MLSTKAERVRHELRDLFSNITKHTAVRFGFHDSDASLYLATTRSKPFADSGTWDGDSVVLTAIQTEIEAAGGSYASDATTATITLPDGKGEIVLSGVNGASGTWTSTV